MRIIENQLKKGVFQLKKKNYHSNKLTLAKQFFTSNEKKIFALIINQVSHLNFQNAESSQHLVHSGNLTVKIPIIEITKYMSYEDVKNASCSLVGKVLGSFEKTEYKFISIFAEINYNQNKNGFFEAVIYEKSVPLFSQLGKEYTSYELSLFLKLKSYYSQRFYELVSLHLGRRERVFSYPVEKLREILNIPESFKNYDLKRSVFSVAQKELQKIGLTFEYAALKKVGKAVVEIQFIVKTDKEIANQKINDDFLIFSELPFEEKNQVVLKLLYDYPFSNQIKDIIANNPRLLEKFIELDRGLEHGLFKDITNPIGYIITSIKNEALLLGIEIGTSQT